MTEQEAIAKLRELYDHAPYGMRGICAWLFGVKYADDLAGLDLEVIAREGASKGYHIDLRKGIRASEYVKPYRELWH